MSWLIGEWSALHRVSAHEGSARFCACEDRPGLYRLVGLRDDLTLDPTPLARVCRQDELGTIYIGAAARSLQSRLGQLVSQHVSSRKRGGHVALPMVLARSFPANRLAVCWSYAGQGQDVFALRHALLMAYCDVFGERPPLNTSG